MPSGSWGTWRLCMTLKRQVYRPVNNHGAFGRSKTSVPLLPVVCMSFASSCTYEAEQTYQWLSCTPPALVSRSHQREYAMLQERLGRVPPQYPHVKIYVLANSRFQECNQTAKFIQLQKLCPVLLEVVKFTYEAEDRNFPHRPSVACTNKECNKVFGKSRSGGIGVKVAVQLLVRTLSNCHVNE